MNLTGTLVVRSPRFPPPGTSGDVPDVRVAFPSAPRFCGDPAAGSCAVGGGRNSLVRGSRLANSYIVYQSRLYSGCSPSTGQREERTRRNLHAGNDTRKTRGAIYGDALLYSLPINRMAMFSFALTDP